MGNTATGDLQSAHFTPKIQKDPHVWGWHVSERVSV